MLRTPVRQHLWYWGGPFAVTLLAAILRLWHLGMPRGIVFDETFYVKDAWTMLHLGYEGSWPQEAGAEPGSIDRLFGGGNVNNWTATGSFVAHPPLGKWLIALGLRLFGAQNIVGWRITTALAGVVAVFILILIARMIFKSTMLATLAGLLFAIDGSAITLSRTALLDNFVMLFALLGFGAILLDRHHSRARLEHWVSTRSAEAQLRGVGWGPTQWFRPWLVAAAVAFGAASAVKWSGLYFLAAFMIYVLVVDGLARRRVGISSWGIDVLFKQAVPTFLITIPIAAATYLASWIGWFATSGGFYRNYADIPGQAATGFFRWVPHAIQSFYQYQTAVLNFNVNEKNPHSYAANPFSWLVLNRPTAFFYSSQATGSEGCISPDSCAVYVTSIPNPIIWYASVFALVYLTYRVIRYREWQVGLILMGTVAGYVPWLFFSHRTIFQFYTIVFEPYLILGLVLVLAMILGKRTDPHWQRRTGIIVTATFVVLAVAVSAFFYPVNAGMQIPLWFANMHYIAPGWR